MKRCPNKCIGQAALDGQSDADVIKVFINSHKRIIFFTLTASLHSPVWIKTLKQSTSSFDRSAKVKGEIIRSATKAAEISPFRRIRIDDKIPAITPKPFNYIINEILGSIISVNNTLHKNEEDDNGERSQRPNHFERLKHAETRNECAEKDNKISREKQKPIILFSLSNF